MENLLKTDLFDEAVSDGLLHYWTFSQTGSICMDISFAVAYQARVTSSGPANDRGRCSMSPIYG